MFRTTPPSVARRPRLGAVGGAMLTVALLAGCSGSDDSTAADSSATTAPDPTGSDASDEAASTGPSDPTSSTGSADLPAAELGAVGSLVSSEVHEISLEFDEDDYDAMIEAYTSTGEKEWIEATVTIDGTNYQQVGIRLKGNSSLGGLGGTGRGRPGGLGGGASADDPASLPWLVQLDKFVDGQDHEGLEAFVVRSNNSETALNEALALELLDAAGLASQDAIATAFSVNGSDPELRLVIDDPNNEWMAEELSADGALYKAESTGDYSYRGDDPESYAEVFDQEAGKDNADLTPLIEFLDFINNSDDETFAAELGERLDVDAFATYLAVQDLIGNSDDIDGPGNNSYLYYDTDTGQMTVVAWDHNLAFGGMGMGPGGFPGGGGRGTDERVFPGGEFPEPPDGMELPTDGEGVPFPADGEGVPPGGGGFQPGGGFGGRSNVLVERFLGVEEWQQLVDDRTEELRAELYASGAAADLLATWTAIVSSSGLVDEATVTAEADAIAAQLG